MCFIIVMTLMTLVIIHLLFLNREKRLKALHVHILARIPDFLGFMFHISSNEDLCIVKLFRTKHTPRGICIACLTK